MLFNMTDVGCDLVSGLFYYFSLISCIQFTFCCVDRKRRWQSCLCINNIRSFSLYIRLYVFPIISSRPLHPQRRASITDDTLPRAPQAPLAQSAPTTPCDSESAAELLWSDKAFFEANTDGVWWWRRPLGVRRTCCRRCGASSSTRPLRMVPCAGVALLEADHERRPRSRDRPLLFV